MDSFKGTKGEWHSVDFAGHTHIMNEPFYDALDILSEDDFNHRVAYNAKLICAAQDLLKACEAAILELQLIPCECDGKVIDQLERAINKATRL